MYELMIIGGGPAGLAAAVYAARKKLKTLLISANIGGQINTTINIENYLGYQFIEGPELIAKFQTQVSQFPIDQKIGVRVARLNKVNAAFEAITESGERYEALAVILATGKKPKRLNVPGEVDYVGKGVSYCAVCDGPVFTSQRVAIIGGGNSGVSAALDMVRIAEHVFLVSLSPLVADQVLIDRLADARNLTIFTEHRVKEILGQQLVEGLTIEDLHGGELKSLDVAGVFVEIGLAPNSNLVEGLVRLNEGGEIQVSPNCQTNVPGLYAAGDVTDVPEKQIIIAAGEGAKAALQAHRYLQRLVPRYER